jgi:cytochrome P450
MRTTKELPGPKGLPLLGNLLQVDLARLHQVLEEWCHEFGLIYSFALGTREVVVVAEPELIQNILRQRPTKFRRMGTIEPVFKEMGITGVFSAEGEQWKRQRRLTAHALDAGHLREFFPTLIKVTERLRCRWHAAAQRHEPADVQQDLMRYTVDVTTNLAFGYDMNTLEKEGDIIQQHLEKIFPMINRRINAAFPYWRYFKLPSDHALDRSLDSVRETITEFISQGRIRLAQHPELAAHPTNFLEAMLGARDEGGAAFTDEEIYGNVLTLLLAGEDTTANTLAWMMHFMVEHPGIQAQMRQEAEQVVGRAGMLGQLQDAERLKYIEAVAHETMRLKPVAPILFLETNEDVEVGDVSIPQATPLMLLTLHPALQDAHFAAAAQFKPERWLDATPAPANAATPSGTPACPHAHNPKAFVPFGAGPRFCPGRNLALVEIKMVMAMLCSTFDLSKPEHAIPVEELFSFTMMPENLSIIFDERGAAAAGNSSAMATTQ